MKKMAFLTILTLVLIVGGTSFALLGRAGSAPESAQADLSPRLAAAVGSSGEADSAAPTASAGCGTSRCGSSTAGSCCSPGKGSQSAAERAEQIRAFLIGYYSRNVGGEISVDVRDFGCHQEAEVKQNGVTIKRLSINGGQIAEIS